MTDPAAFPKIISLTKTWHTKPYNSISPGRPELSVAGKSVVVTGGGTGIGKAVAIAFTQASAKSVAILGRRLDRLKRSAEVIAAAAPGKTQVLYEAADLTDRTQVDRALDTILSKTGDIDIFVSSAGALSELGPIAEYERSKLMHAFEQNVLTTVNAMQTFAVRAGPEPIFLNVSSGTVHTVPVRDQGAYNASKLAALKLVDQFAAENPRFHVVHVHPGWIATEMNGMQKEAPDAAELPGQFCVWLTSPEARFLRGKFLWVNWDVEELLQRAYEIQTTKLLSLVLEGVPM